MGRVKSITTVLLNQAGVVGKIASRSYLLSSVILIFLYVLKSCFANRSVIGTLYPAQAGVLRSSVYSLLRNGTPNDLDLALVWSSTLSWTIRKQFVTKMQLVHYLFKSFSMDLQRSIFSSVHYSSEGYMYVIPTDGCIQTRCSP